MIGAADDRICLQFLASRDTVQRSSMNLLRYNVAMSLDGFIAREDGAYDWIPADPGVDFAALFAGFDSFVMGRKTYELVQQGPSLAGKILVVSKTLSPAEHPDVEIVSDNIPDRVRQFKADSKKDVWLFGGGQLFRYLLDEGLVDRIEVGVIPVLIGSGIPLIPAGQTHKLKLLAHDPLPTGVTMLTYSVAAKE